ncbi:3-deoxy-D-manno-octulosonic acid transferase [Endozoicomonas sp. (ex Bugula neritina AB1)]|nr:3-deoxy-D-manno-octulosonic acid transferase [Endozoicomonas sp. (ex Bugula neritina AB1)]
MNRFIYSILLYLASPIVMGRLFIRARKSPAYGLRKAERFGFFRWRPDGKSVIWIHSVSVGETIASAPMVNALKQLYPNHQILITTMTPTGSDQVKKIHGESVAHVYAPYDLPDAVHRFIKAVSPEVAIIIDTELWPNTIAACHQRNIPVILVNARLSERSAKGYGKLGRLTRNMLQQISTLAAQDQEGGQRFIELGLSPSHLSVTGSVKFDLDVSPNILAAGKVLRQRWQNSMEGDVRLLIAASTHEGEDQKILNAFKEVRASDQRIRLILVPRHPERFDTVFSLIRQNDLEVVRHSEGSEASLDTQVILGDTMGEMMTLFAASDIAFVGGSLVETGGHNMLEPAALNLPVLSGPHVFNFAEISSSLEKAGGLKLVQNESELAEAVLFLLGNQQACSEMGDNAQAFVDANRGALQRTLDIISNSLSR